MQKLNKAVYICGLFLLGQSMAAQPAMATHSSRIAGMCLDYGLNRVQFNPKDLKSDEHRARHQLGRIPVLEDEDFCIF